MKRERFSRKIESHKRMCFTTDLVKRSCSALNQNQPLLLTRFEIHIYTLRRRFIYTKQVFFLFLLFTEGFIGHRLTDPGRHRIQDLPGLRAFFPSFIFANKAPELFVKSLWKRFVFTLQIFEMHNRNKIAVDVSYCSVQLFIILLSFHS